jgi:hypothetical protein
LKCGTYERNIEPVLTVGEYIQQTQPEVLTAINYVWGPYPIQDEELLTPFQKFLDRLMRQKPRPGIAGTLRGEEP